MGFDGDGWGLRNLCNKPQGKELRTLLDTQGEASVFGRPCFKNSILDKDLK